jgi:hypothetical protein
MGVTAERPFRPEQPSAISRRIAAFEGMIPSPLGAKPRHIRRFSRKNAGNA